MPTAQRKLTLEQLWAQARDLLPGERATLATRILDSFASPATDGDAWVAEAADRLAAFDRREMAAVSAQTALASAREAAAAARVGTGLWPVRLKPQHEPMVPVAPAPKSDNDIHIYD